MAIFIHRKCLVGKYWLNAQCGVNIKSFQITTALMLRVVGT